jgi:hypothetical protein
MKFSFLAISLIVILSLTSCVSYLQDRAKDGAEMIDLGVGLSYGVDLSARVTRAIQAGFGAYEGDWVGLQEARFAHWYARRVEMGVSPLFFHEIYRTSDRLIDIRHPMFSGAFYDEYMNDLFLITDRGFFSVGATINLIFLGVDAKVELAEVADFVTGWFGLDILLDDPYSRTSEELLVQARSMNARKRNTAIRALQYRTGLEFGYVQVTVPEEYPEDQVQAWRDWKAWMEGGD